MRVEEPDELLVLARQRVAALAGGQLRAVPEQGQAGADEGVGRPVGDPLVVAADLPAESQKPLAERLVEGLAAGGDVQPAVRLAGGAGLVAEGVGRHVQLPGHGVPRRAVRPQFRGAREQVAGLWGEGGHGWNRVETCGPAGRLTRGANSVY
ncbi:MAG: hypothetical protein K2P78_02290, partial [Gemmataceae bacterium]|nr:hypothetical protein [Gemmataceae bacterium]